jgi:hypothetical protein
VTNVGSYVAPSSSIWAPFAAIIGRWAEVFGLRLEDKRLVRLEDSGNDFGSKVDDY